MFNTYELMNEKEEGTVEKLTYTIYNQGALKILEFRVSGLQCVFATDYQNRYARLKIYREDVRVAKFEERQRFKPFELIVALVNIYNELYQVPQKFLTMLESSEKFKHFRRDQSKGF